MLKSSARRIDLSQPLTVELDWSLQRRSAKYTNDRTAIGEPGSC